MGVLVCKICKTHTEIEEPYLHTPKSFSDELTLQAIFPEEVWLLIFNKIKNSNHYNRIDAASPYFHKLLLPLRTCILFPEVINLYIKSTVWTDESYFSMLQCRSTCKAWMQGVDATLHQVLSEINTDATNWKIFGISNQILNRYQANILFQPDIYNQRKLEKFLGVFYNSHFLTGRNPFPSRSIHIHIRSDLTMDSKLFDILQIYGHHIWHCDARLNYQSPQEMQQQVLIFCKLLGLLPHLKSLRIENLYYLNDNANSEYLKSILRENPMPKLKNLQLLLNHHIPGPVFSELIQNSPHIKRLWISKLDFSNHSALLSTPLPNLEELQILDFKSEADFLQLQFVQFQCPLKNLTILCHDSVPHVNSVFSWIEERWAETLTHLSICLPWQVSVSEIESSLKLPSLENLRIRKEHYFCLDFILHLSKSLVSLSVYHEGIEIYDERLEENSKIQFFCHRKNLGRSNIWKFLPRLREIKFADRSEQELCVGRTYRRDQWEGYSSAGN